MQDGRRSAIISQELPASAAAAALRHPSSNAHLDELLVGSTASFPVLVTLDAASGSGWTRLSVNMQAGHTLWASLSSSGSLEKSSSGGALPPFMAVLLLLLCCAVTEGWEEAGWACRRGLLLLPCPATSGGNTRLVTF